MGKLSIQTVSVHPEVVGTRWNENWERKREGEKVTRKLVMRNELKGNKEAGGVGKREG